MRKFTFDEENSQITLSDGTTISLNTPEAFKIISDAWLRVGWDTKYVYGFSWFGRPIIQLPEDIIRIQELVYELRPDYIIETGVAHGGSLIFYASLLKALGKGKVIGIDVDIRKHNREAIEKHELKNLIKLVEGDSTSREVIDEIESALSKNKKVLVILDSNHSKEHVLKELKLYSNFISEGSYIVACDGIMKQVVGAPRSKEDWEWNNPLTAIEEFLEYDKSFNLSEPEWPFNEGSVKERVTYWPNAYLKKGKIIN